MGLARLTRSSAVQRRGAFVLSINELMRAVFDGARWR
jgi:hypothetical protein